MRDPNECKYCNNTGEMLFDTRTKLSSKGDFYPGIEVYVEDNKLEIAAVPDVYEPGYEEATIEINYCPMCGRSLKDERSE